MEESSGSVILWLLKCDVIKPPLQAGCGWAGVAASACLTNCTIESSQTSYPCSPLAAATFSLSAARS